MQQFKLFALGALLLAGFVNNVSAQELGKIRYRVEAGPTLSKVSNFALDHGSDTGKGLQVSLLMGEVRSRLRIVIVHLSHYPSYRPMLYRYQWTSPSVSSR